MQIVDSHCHAGESWFEPVEALVHQMDDNSVEKGVLIQHMGVFDNSYLLDCAKRFPGRFTVVALVDASRPDASDMLGQLVEEGVKGIRLSPEVRSPGGDPLLIWRNAAEFGLTVSSLGTLEDFASDNFRGIVEQLPSLSLVIEHLGGIGQSDDGSPYTQFRRFLELSEYPNTYIKVPGLGEISTRPLVLSSNLHFEDTPPVIEMVMEAFGPRRMMWGSDFPPVSNREGYRNALRGVMEYPAIGLGPDMDWVMGKTATSAFKIT